MITEKDRKILKHIYEYSFITLEEARLIAFPEMKRGYEYIRTRMKRLCDVEKMLKVTHNTALKLNVFVDINADIRKTPISAHKIYLMDVYCKLKSMGANIEKFEVDKEWSNGKYKSSLITYEYIGYKFINIIEVNTNNNSLNINKFDEIEDEIKLECKGITPKIILLDDIDSKEYKTKSFKIIRMNYNLSNFEEILL